MAVLELLDGLLRPPPLCRYRVASAHGPMERRQMTYTQGPRWSPWPCGHRGQRAPGAYPGDRHRGARRHRMGAERADPRMNGTPVSRSATTAARLVKPQSATSLAKRRRLSRCRRRRASSAIRRASRIRTRTSRKVMTGPVSVSTVRGSRSPRRQRLWTLDQPLLEARRMPTAPIRNRMGIDRHPHPAPRGGVALPGSAPPRRRAPPAPGRWPGCGRADADAAGSAMAGEHGR